TARPYALTTLLVVGAVIAFREWWRRDERRWSWAGAYVACTFLAGWLHLITLPFTLLPFIFCGIAALATRRTVAGASSTSRHSGASRNPVSSDEQRIVMHDRWRRVASLLLLGAITALPLALALLPPLLNDFGALSGKSGSDAVSLQTLYRATLL